MSISVKRKAVFIDRDGVINEERNYVHRTEDFSLLPGVIDGLAKFRDAGYHLVVVTNQAGIARGYYNHEAMNRLHDHLRAQLANYTIKLDAIYFCPHHPLGSVQRYAVECDCRKPAPGMLLQAVQDFGFDLSNSILIGDKLSDIQAGKRAGVGKNVLVESGHVVNPSEHKYADLVTKNLLTAALILTGVCSIN